MTHQKYTNKNYGIENVIYEFEIIVSDGKKHGNQMKIMMKKICVIAEI
jgi:hypothetical protein